MCVQRELDSHGEGKSARLQGSHMEGMGNGDLVVSTPCRLFLFQTAKETTHEGFLVTLPTLQGQ